MAKKLIAQTQFSITNMASQTYEDICTHDTTTGLIECTHAQDQGCVRVTEIQGKSEQVQSTLGKNLFNGVFHDGFIDLNTGAITSAPTDHPSSVYSDLIRLYSGKTYIVSGHNGQDMRHRLFNLNGSYAKSISFNDQYTSDGDYYVRLLWYQGLTNEQKSKIQLEEGTTSTAYEPFIPNSPSPDYPSVINSVGDSGKLNVVSSVGRRNLIPNTNQGKNGWTYTPANNIDGFKTENFTALGVNAVKLTCTATAGSWGAFIYHRINRGLIKNNTKYTLAFDVYSNVTDNHSVLLRNAGGTSLLGSFGTFSTAANKWLHIELHCTTNSEIATDQILGFTPFNRIGEVVFANLQMAEGDSIDKYSPAPEDITPENFKQYEDKLSLATVNLTSPLRSLPNGIHDVLECKDGIWGVTRNISTNPITFPPTGGHSEYAKVGNGSVRRSWVNNSFICRDPNEICVLSEKYAADTWNNMHLSSGGLSIEKPFAICGWDYSGNSRFDIMVPESVLITKDAAGLTAYLTANPPTFYAQLKTPTWEPLDDPSQKALNNLLSYSDKDYIYTTDPLGTNFSVAVKSRAFYENFKLQEEIKNTNTSLGDLDDEIKGGFYDGIINTNEAEAIRKATETMHTQVTNQFNKVDSNPSLTGAPKTTHQTKYTECNNAYNTLISKINTAIEYCSVNSTKTDAQKKTAVTDMNTAFGTYKTKLADYQKAYQDAIDAIAKKKAGDAVDGVVIGGRNLLLDSGRVITTTTAYNIVNYKTSSLKPNTKYTFVINGFTNSGNSLGVWFNGGGAGGGRFPETTVAKTQYIVVTTPGTLNNTTVNIFNYPSSTASNATINWACMYEGETKPPLDWTPAPEDTDEKITQVSATLTSTINDVQHTVDKNTKSITDKVWKSDIITGIKDLNVGGINLWDLSAIKRYASGSLYTIVAGTSVDAKTGKITVTADPQAVPGCKIDVSTLTRNSSNVGELIITGYFDRSDSDDNKLKNVYLYYRCFNNANAEIQAHTNKLVPVETSSNLFAGTLSIPANTAYINFGVGQIPYAKPYTLTGITVKDSALYDITKGLRDQVSQAYQDISGFKQTVSDTYTTKTEFDNLQVSAKNLARGTTGELRGYTPTTGTNSTFDYANVYTSGLKVGDTVTVAIDVEYANRGSASGQTHGIWFQGAAQPGSVWTTNPFTGCIGDFTSKLVGSSGTIHLTGKAVMTAGHLKYEHFNFGVRSDYSNGTATYKFKNLMVVRGEKEMDWTPAPEDIDKKFTNYSTTSEMNSKIEQTKKAIELGVSQTYTSKAEGDKITQGLNKWILEVYQLTSSSMPNPRVADIENIRGKVPTKIVEVADTSTNTNINVGDYYIGHAFTYLYFDTAYTWSGTIITNEEGTVYLNGVKKVSTAVLVSTNVTLPFQAGWNVLEVVYNEGTSNDGWLFSSKLSALSQCKIMNCYAQVSLNASALIKVTADAINSKVENNSAYSEVVQNSGKIKWLVASGKDPASMELTPEALNVVVKHINLNGDVKVNGDMLVNGSITAPKIAAKAITADKIAIGDFTNYAQLNVDTLSKWGFTSVDDPSASANPWYKRNNITRDNFISEWYPCNGGESFRIKADIKTTVKGSSTNGGTDSDFRGVTVGIYCYSNIHGVSTYYAQRVTNQTQSISSVVTLNSNIRKFAVFVQIEGWAPFTGELFVRNVQVTKMSTGELIVDGSVTADKMNVKGLTVSDGSKNTLAIDNAGNVSLDVKSLRITGSAAATQSEAQGYASSAKSEAISAAASDASTKANNAKTDALNAAKTYTDNGLGSKLDASWMTQKNIFDKLTNNGALQGIYMEGGKLYINGEYIKANSIDADRLIVGMNPNLVRYGLDTMEQYTAVPYYYKMSTTTLTLDSALSYVGTKSIKVSGTSTTNDICLGNSNSDYGCIPVISGKKYIISCYVRNTTTSQASVSLGIVGHSTISSSATSYTTSTNGTVTSTEGWKRLVLKYTATTSFPYISIRISLSTSGIPVWFDAFQIEEVDDLGKEPGAFKQAGTTIIDGGNITTGIIKDSANNFNLNLATGVITAKKLSINSTNFTLSETGVVTAKSGSIGGWNITTESMNRQFTANNKNYWLYFDTGTTTDNYAAFMLRTKATAASGWEDKFSIAWNGRMTAMDADVRGAITATSGKIAGFTILGNKLYAMKTMAGQTFESFTINPDGGESTSNPLLSVKSTLLGTPELLVTQENVMIRDLSVTKISSNVEIPGNILKNGVPLNNLYWTANANTGTMYAGNWYYLFTDGLTLPAGKYLITANIVDEFTELQVWDDTAGGFIFHSRSTYCLCIVIDLDRQRRINIKGKAAKNLTMVVSNRYNLFQAIKLS